jgi:hypothetical protein
VTDRMTPACVCAQMGAKRYRANRAFWVEVPWLTGID